MARRQPKFRPIPLVLREPEKTVELPPRKMPVRRPMSMSSSVMASIYGDRSMSRDEIDRLCERSPGQFEWLGAFVLPPFQRPPVWTLEQNVKLIESIWLGYDIGRYTIIDTWGRYNKWSDCLIDGQQRIRAIISYRNDEFPVFGCRFSELSLPESREFDNTVFPRAAVSNEMTEAEYRDIYNRLNYGGTIHTEAQRA